MLTDVSDFPYRVEVVRSRPLEVEPGITIGYLDVQVASVRVIPTGDDEDSLEIVSVVRDRDTGGPTRIRFHARWDRDWSDKEKADGLRAALLEMMAHEVDEMITVNGVRVFDPHAPMTMSSMTLKITL